VTKLYSHLEKVNMITGMNFQDENPLQTHP